MSRFDLATKNKVENEKALAELVNKAKHVREIQTFNSTGEFNVKGKVSNFWYRLYAACPQKNCRRKLNDEKFCTSCARYVKEPQISMFLKLEMEDLVEGNLIQPATMFCAVAEKFLGIQAQALSQMTHEERDRVLEEHIGRQISFRVSIKEPKNDDFSDGSLDWQIKKFVDTVADEEDDVDGPPAAKKSKKNDGGFA